MFRITRTISFIIHHSSSLSLRTRHLIVYDFIRIGRVDGGCVKIRKKKVLRRERGRRQNCETGRKDADVSET
jgi:hypothetical protein